MLKTYKIALDPNNKQMAVLAQSAGAARFAYNWALSEWSRMYAEWQIDNDRSKPNQMLLRRNLNAIKRTEFPWMLDVTKCAPQEAIINLGRAFENFFGGRGAYPTFKKRGVHDSFKVSSGFFRVEDKTIKIPHAGKVRMREELCFDGTPKSVTISRTANRWFASITVEVGDAALQTNCHIPVVGIDVGVNDFVQDDGSRIVVPQAYREAEKRLRRAQKTLSRKEKGSKNRRKAQMKVAKLHAKASSIRSDSLHKYSTGLARNARTIVIEDLNVKGMVKNHHLARSIANAAFGEFRRQLTYKREWNGRELVVADRFFPSSKRCSFCGHKVDKLPLNVREWSCCKCNTKHDRDINAVMNLRLYAESSPVSACGGFFASDGGSLPASRQAASARQELSTRPAWAGLCGY